MNKSPSPTYLIYGAGAIGSVLGAFLHKINRPVTFAGRGAHFRAMKQEGLRIKGIWGDHLVPKEEIRTLSYPRNETDRFSTILLSVKSRDTESAAREAAPLLAEDGIMVSIQNGLGNWETIARFVGRERTVGARVIFGAEIPCPGQANVTVNADDVLLGEAFTPVNRDLLQTLNRDLQLSGIPARVVTREEIWSALWGKVLYNCSLNPLGAILEVPYGRLGEDEEIFRVCQALNVSLPHRDAEEYYRFLLEKQLPPTSDHRASMLQDILLGRETEIEALNGAISRLAQENGIPVPYNHLLTLLIKFKEKKASRGAGPRS